MRTHGHRAATQRANNVPVLTALTQRQSPGELSGTMFVDNHPVDRSFNRQIGYCQQMDIHDETSTVWEAFEFSALLRQGPEVSKEDKLSYANTVLHTLGLADLQNALIGSMDIEKKKRVTIGVELCAKPKLLLFLDVRFLSPNFVITYTVLIPVRNRRAD